MGKVTGFLEYARQEPGHLPVAERIQRYRSSRSPWPTPR